MPEAPNTVHAGYNEELAELDRQKPQAVEVKRAAVCMQQPKGEKQAQNLLKGDRTPILC